MLWGFGHGLWLVVERHAPAWPGAADSRFARVVRTLLVFHGVCLLWVLFRSPTLAAAGDYFARLLAPPFTSTRVPQVLAVWLIGFALLQAPVAWTLKERRFVQRPLAAQWLLALAALYLVLAYAGARVDFIYFMF